MWSIECAYSRVALQIQTPGVLSSTISPALCPENRFLTILPQNKVETQLPLSINLTPPFQIGALPIFVVDGDAPSLKMRERLKRFHAMNGTRMPEDSGREHAGSVRRNYEFESNVQEVVVSNFSHSVFFPPRSFSFVRSFRYGIIWPSYV